MNETAANQPVSYSSTELAATQRTIAPPLMPDAMQLCNTNNNATLP